jgi:hypothetical protein
MTTLEKPATIPELELHPLCIAISACSEKEQAELKENIKNNKLQVPIKLFRDKILDGRGRYNACVELAKDGIDTGFRSEVFLGTEEDARKYVVSANLVRRNLSASQRALSAARLVNTKLGGDRSVKLPTEISRENAAKLLGISVKSVTDGVKVLSHPDLVAKIEKGELAVNKAAQQIREAEKKAEAAAPGRLQDAGYQVRAKKAA